MTRRRSLHRWLGVLAALCLVLAVLLTGLRVACFFGAMSARRITEAKSIRDGSFTMAHQRGIAIEGGSLSFAHVHAEDTRDTASQSVRWDWHWYQPDAAALGLQQSQSPAMARLDGA